MQVKLCGIFLLLLSLLYPSYARDPECVSCTLGLKVWCPQTRTCVNTLLDCPVMDVSAISWFINEGLCSVDPIVVFTSCPLVVANFDPRLPPGTVLSGNQIMIPIQPRILVDDFAANLTYDVGGFFSVIPTDSQQKPQFFFFSKSVDRFVASLHYRPYSNYENRDEFSVNSSQVIQFLDMTVVANVGLRYEMVFVVSRAGSLDHCAFTPSLVFQQTPTYYDFRFTLGAIGLVVWLLGTFALMNFMIYFNSREERELAQRNLPLLAVSNSPNFPNSPNFGSSSQGSMDDVVVSVKEKKTFKEKFKTWRGLMWNECKKFIRSCSMSDKEFLTEYGVSLYHYIWFHRMAIIAICAAVACALGLPTDLVGGANRDTVAGDFATSTIASVTLDSYANLVHFFIVVINVSLAIGFVWRLRKLSFAVVIAEEKDALPAQEYAIEIKGLPKHVLDEQLLKSHFASIYGEDQIISAHIPLAYGSRWKLEEIKEEKDKYDKEFEETKLRPRIFRHFWHIYSTKKKVDAINYYEEKINKIRPKLKFTDPNRGTGYAYVTFADRDVVRQCLKNNNHSTRWFWFRKLISLFTSEEVSAKPNPHFTAEHSTSLGCLKWSVMPAPLPSEIIWPNLENSATKKSLLQFFGLFLEIIVLACVLSVTLGFALIEVTRDLYLTDVYYQFGGATMLEAIASLTIVILPEAVAIIEEVVAPVVETVEEKAGHVHKSGWRKTVMWHTAFFELMSGIVISRMIYFLIGVAVLYDAQPPLNSYHYLFNKTGMDMMKYMCIKTFTVYGIKYPALCLIKLFQARLSGKLERPDFDYFDLYAQKIMVMFCVLMYGSVMPLILPLGVMYLGISFLYDRWAIVNFHKKDVAQDSKLLFYAADICSFYFAIVPLATLVIITKLFEFWPALAGTLIGFSVIVGIVMLETRRWQYMNQNLKGIRKIIKASDHTLAKHMNATTPLVGPDGAASENNDNNVNNGEITEDESQTKAKQKWKKLANTAKVKDVFSGVIKGMREGVISTKVEKGQRTEEDVLRSAYIHPLSVTKI